MLSLIELQRKKVEAKRKKYDKDEMDAYLELVYENYKGLLEQTKKLEAEKAELSQKAKKLSDGVQYYRSIETTLQKALILAEKTSKETKDAALMKAEAIEKDANKRADEIIRTAEGEYNKIKGKCMLLVQQFNQYKHQLIEAASAQLEMVEGDDFDIGDPDEYENASHSSSRRRTHRTASAPEPVPSPEPVPVPKQASEPVVQPESAPVPSPEPAPAPVPKQASEPVVQPSAPEPVIQPAPAPQQEKPKLTPEEILRADTIDLRTTLDAIQSFEHAAAAEVQPQPAEAPANISAVDSGTQSFEHAAAAEVQPQPVEAPANISTAGLVMEQQPAAPEESISEIQIPASSGDAEQTQAELQAKAPEPSDILIAEPVQQTQADNLINLMNVKNAETVEATIVEPVQAKTVDPLDAMFEPQVTSGSTQAKDQVTLEPAAEELVQPKTAEPLDAMFESQITDNSPEKKQMTLEPSAKEPETVPTLDALLQDLNINNRNNQKSDDPFEFLGSIDDDF